MEGSVRLSYPDMESWCRQFYNFDRVAAFCRDILEAEQLILNGFKISTLAMFLVALEELKKNIIINFRF